MREKILNKFKDLDFIIFLLGGVVLASLFFVLFYRVAITRYDYYYAQCSAIVSHSPLVAYNGSSLFGYSLISKIFGGHIVSYYWIGYSLFVLAYASIGVIGYLAFYKSTKLFSRYYQIILIPILLMLLLNSGHLLSSFEAFIIPLSFAFLGINSLVFYILYKKNGFKSKYLYIYLAITCLIQILFGSLLSMIVIVLGGICSLTKYLKSKNNNFLIASLSSLTILLGYAVLLVFSANSSGLIFDQFSFTNILIGFLTNLSSAVVGPYSKTRVVPSFVFIIVGSLTLAIVIGLIIFDSIKSKAFSKRAKFLTLLTAFVLLETILNGGTLATLYFNSFGFCSSVLVISIIFIVIYDLKHFIHVEKMNPDLRFFIGAAVLCLLLVGCLLSFGYVGNL